jgi:polysaccharide biosynthesis PFTS motif protein
MCDERREGTSAQSVSRVVLYHHLTDSHLPVLQQIRSNGIDIACLTADASALNILGDSIRRLDPPGLPHPFEVVRPDELIEVMEVVFGVLSRRSPCLPWVHRLYGSSDIDYSFKMALLWEISPLFSLASLISRSLLNDCASVALSSEWPGSRQWPLFLNLWKQGDFRQRLAAHLPRPICEALDRLEGVDESEQGIADAVKRYAMALYYVTGNWYQMLRRLKLRARSLPVARLILRTYATDWSINYGGHERLRNVDFVVDGKELPLEDVAIWVEPGTSEERQQVLRERGYRSIGFGSVTFGPVSFVRRALPLLFSYTALLPKLMCEDRWWSRQVANLVYYCLIWREVCHRIKPAAFLVYNDLSSLGIARNIVLRQYGCHSVFYQHACNLPIKESGDWDLFCPYLVFDAVAVWGPDHTSLYRCRASAIRDSWEIGCLWSEHARMVKENTLLNKKYNQQLASLVKVPLDRYRRRVAVFDTSVSGMLSASDLFSFYVGILRLSQRLRDALFVCKPKYPIKELFSKAEGLDDRIRQDIEEAPNIVFLPAHFETAVAVGLTDLTISACFTSTTVEAIGCGKRAIYYNPTNRMPQAFWCRIPGMVCATDEELYHRVRHLLYECDQESYLEYLRTHCMGVEGHFDGRATTRLRHRLLDVMKSRRTVTASYGQQTCVY